MCYRLTDPPVDFSGIHLACLAGDNGHGKSALLDAITWSLWGRARARTDDELITLGQNDMAVEFEFALGGDVYRVLRKRQRGKASSLELQVKAGEVFRPLTGTTIRDTERKVVDVLRMEYETFINSAFLLQGRADEFTVKPPAERKKVLADILGLAYYDTLEERARQKSREREISRRELEAAIREIDAELARRPQYDAELVEAQARVDHWHTRAQGVEAQVQELQRRRGVLVARQQELATLEVRLSHDEAELNRIVAQIEDHQQAIRRYETTLARAEEIAAGFAALQAARARQSALTAVLTRLQTLTQARQTAQRALDAARHALINQQQVLQSRLNDRLQVAGQAAACEQSLQQVRAGLADLDRLEAEREARRNRQMELSNHNAELKAHNDQLRREMESLRARLDSLGNLAACPTCGRPLTDTERETIKAGYQAEGQAKKLAYQENQTAMRAGDAEMAQISREIAAIEARLKQRPEMQRREAQLDKGYQEAIQAAAEVATLQDQLAGVNAQLEQENFAPAERGELCRIEAEIADLHYDPQAAQAIQAELTRWAPFDDEQKQLAMARQSLDQSRSTLKTLLASQERWEAGLRENRAKREALRAEVTGLPALETELRGLIGQLEQARREEANARLALGAAQQKIDFCRQKAIERQEKVAQENAAREERVIYEELAQAFGKKGVQAMLIEMVVPEIEAEANRLLARMTDGRMTVKFETQRDTKKGDTIETLDIKIADEMGTRNYELYSGGEAFRANFAIRIALSKLLARRSGARLQTLVIDEGFGTQDTQGRERLVDAIRSIQDDFERILVITHIQELRDVFPAQLLVTKTTAGSQVTVI